MVIKLKPKVASAPRATLSVEELVSAVPLPSIWEAEKAVVHALPFREPPLQPKSPPLIHAIASVHPPGITVNFSAFAQPAPS
jgi:hypothetical protein